MSFDIEKYKQTALKILTPIKPADKNTLAKDNFLFTAERSNAGRGLSEYFLVYFLFNNLLGFKNLGKSEKIAWSFPIDYKGKAFLIEYRKFGVGVFVQDKDKDEVEAEEIVKKVNGAIKSIRPFYDYLAEEAVKKSEFNIVNNNQRLYDRFLYLKSLYKKERKKYLKNKDKIKTETKEFEYGKSTSYVNLGFQYHQNSNWLAISCIEAFFSWTEHLFIHLAVIAENMSNGEDIANLIEGEWKTKFKAAIKNNSKEANKFYDELLIVRQQLRNYVAHGAFGKNGNAFYFHSGTGAVPVLMNHKKQKNRFSLHGYLTFNEEEVIKLIEDFVKFLWKGSLKPAMYYTQGCALPTILTLAGNGTYATATTDIKTMREFSDHLMREIDNAANMDW
ncbi:hypothetical protein [Tenuifilum osseticum]|uniref:hypothetical protein n=1 Tax=Tenuifilum osseticum TaxID=3374723 RepID=UPI0034E606E4